jgi:hypothetical protein
MHKRSLLFLVALCLSMPQGALSQTVADVRQYTTFRCDFDTSSARILTTQQTEIEKSDSVKDIVFAQVDYEAQKALVIGDNGSTAVLPVLGEETLHLLELTDTSNLTTTTIFSKTGKLTSVGAVTQMVYRAVMSRHVAGLAPEGLVSQYYGSCRAFA